MRFSQSTHLLFLSSETLSFIIRTDLAFLMELINLVNSGELTQMVNFPTWIRDCDSHGPALLDLFLTADASICSTMTSPSLGNSDRVVVSVSIDFPSNSPWDAPFHCIAYDYSRADLDDLGDHLRDISWEDIIKTCVHYFSLFLKDKCISSLFRMKYIEKKFNLQLFFIPIIHEHSLLLGLTQAACLLKTSCFEKRTACVIETMLMT